MREGRYADCTGRLAMLVPGDEELLGLVRIGIRFKTQQVGRRPGTLSLLILDCARTIGRPTFAKLLKELELHAARRNLHGESASCVEKVDRVWQLVTVHTKQGREQIPFATVRNHLTIAKKTIRTEISASANP